MTLIEAWRIICDAFWLGLFFGGAYCVGFVVLAGVSGVVIPPVMAWLELRKEKMAIEKLRLEIELRRLASGWET